MSTTPPTNNKSAIKRGAIVLATLLVGLALAPGYLLLCGHSSGKLVSRTTIFNAAEPNNVARAMSVTVPLTRDMNPVGINIIIETPFRNHAKGEAVQFDAALSKGERQLWTTGLSLGHGHKRETIAGTTFTIRARSFRIDEDGQYQFKLAGEDGWPDMRSIALEVRSGVMVPKRWVIWLGLLIIAGVVVWAIIPAKGYDPAAERIGTKWYED